MAGTIKLRRRIELFLRRTRMSPTRFGRLAIRDPRFLDDLRAGRRPRPQTVARVTRWLNVAEKTP